MEALDFLKEAQRMCKSYADCKGCPLKSSACGLIRCMENYSDEYMRGVTKVVEQWSREHPIVTNAQKFEEVFGLTIECDTNLDRDRRAFTIQSKDESWRKKQSEWLDLPYKEPSSDV